MSNDPAASGTVPGAGPVRLQSAPPADTLTRSAESSVQTAADRGVTTAVPASRAGDIEWPFLLNQQKYLLESARFADQKAAFAFAFSLGCLAFLHQQKAFARLRTPGIPIGDAWVPAVAGALLLLSCGLLLAAVLPRLWFSSEHQLNLVFWEDVCELKTASKYFEVIRQASSDTLHREVCDHCFTLAGICSRKFNLVKYGMWTGVVGAVLGLFAVL